jgi:hypothetical protein
MVLAYGTFLLTFVGFFFLRVLPHSAYHSVPSGSSSRGISDSQLLRRASSDDAKFRRSVSGDRSDPEAGTSPTVPSAKPAHTPCEEGGEVVPSSEPSAASTLRLAMPEALHSDYPDEHAVDETSSLVSSASSLPGDILVQSSVDMDRSRRIDIRGVQMLRLPEFWRLFSIMGILAGIGLMTIKYVI